MKQWYEVKKSMRESDPTCPHCQEMVSDYWDHNISYEPVEIECENCNKSFYVSKDSPSYTSWEKE